MGRLTGDEQETLILYNQKDKTAEVFTYNPSLIRKLDAICLSNPNEFKRTEDNDDGGYTYTFPKRQISIRPPATEARKQAGRERMAQRGHFGVKKPTVQGDADTLPL